MKVSNMNCEFFITHDRVERQVGLNEVLNYFPLNRLNDEFNSLLKNKESAGKMDIDENTYCVLEPVATRNWE